MIDFILYIRSFDVKISTEFVCYKISFNIYYTFFFMYIDHERERELLVKFKQRNNKRTKLLYSNLILVTIFTLNLFFLYTLVFPWYKQKRNQNLIPSVSFLQYRKDQSYFFDFKYGLSFCIIQFLITIFLYAMFL